MASERKEGGPAFPGERVVDRAVFDELRQQCGVVEAKARATFTAPGMTLRDYFAGQALAGMLASEEAGPAEKSWGQPQDMAAHAYALADAMLAERDR